MRYDEKEEILTTKEWLLKIHKVGFSEELYYLPSRLDELGVAPKDVVDKQEWLRDHYYDSVDSSEEPSPSEADDPPVESTLLDYDSFGPWEWVGHVESMMECSIRSIFVLEPDLPYFNDLVDKTRRRRRGKAARAASRPSASKLVS